MRHNYSGRKLNRKSSHRLALLKNLSKSLITHEQIETTLPKAKDLRPFVEKILTMGKNNCLASKRKVFAYMRDKKLVDKIFNVLAKRYQKRNGGYVRILKSGFRYGDAAPKAIIELVERDSAAKGYDDKIRLKDKNKENENQVDQKIEEKKPKNSKKEKDLKDPKEVIKNKDVKEEENNNQIKNSTK